MTRAELILQIEKKKSYLCVGLDIDPNLIPDGFDGDEEGQWQFLQSIIELTLPYAVAYKPNFAFYESQGQIELHLLERLMGFLSAKDVFIIADAKRGDIGNTANQYAQSVFGVLGADAITLSPYMGKDSIDPFLDWEGKWSILLALTSNQGSEDFQRLKLANGTQLFEEVLSRSSTWGNADNMMYVVGATHPADFKTVRDILPNHFLLVPGIGAQGGDLVALSEAGINPDVGLLVNVGRSLIYPKGSGSWSENVISEAKKLQSTMADCIEKYR
jgi:orotidine-5'-phosphate decarboxylase